MKNLLVLTVLVSLAHVVPAQTVQPERFLVPIIVQHGASLPGAFGSRWTSMLLFRNDTAESVAVVPHPRNCQGVGTCPPVVSFPPGSTVELAFSPTLNVPAALVSVERRSAGPVAFNLRVRDVSRAIVTWGTQIPVIPEREFRRGRTILAGVPLTNEFRHTLRLYDVSGVFTQGTLVRVRVFGITPSPHFHESPPPPPDSLLGEAVVPIGPAPAGQHLIVPGYTEIHNLEQIAPLAGWDLATVEIEPLSDGMQYWAFITVTNNETQHVTTVTP